MKKRMLAMWILFLGLSRAPVLAHDHEEETSDPVGPKKGILVAEERRGFKLSPEAIRHFEITSRKLEGNAPWSIPSSAIVRSGEEVNLYRIRDGFLKRIDFETKRTRANELMIASEDLRSGDEIALTGLGFLRIAELAAFGGVADGHSH